MISIFPQSEPEHFPPWLQHGGTLRPCGIYYNSTGLVRHCKTLVKDIYVLQSGTPFPPPIPPPPRMRQRHCLDTCDNTLHNVFVHFSEPGLLGKVVKDDEDSGGGGGDDAV